MTRSVLPASEHTAEPGPDPEELGTREQLRWFGTLWVIAAAAHFTDERPLGVLSALAFGLPLLAYPTSAAAFGLFVAGAAVTAAMALPEAANHHVLSLFVALAFGGAAARAWARRNRADGRGGFLVRWFQAARTPAMLTLLVVYLFTVFHKLNTAFFDPATSCAGALLGNMIKDNGLAIGVDPAVVWVAAIGTVLVETAILVLLAVPRTRRWGLLLGIGFHLVLAPASFWDFATMVFALYLLFVPTRVFAGLAPRAVRARRIALIAFGVHLLLSVAVSLSGGASANSLFGLRSHTLIVLAWYVAVIPMLVALLRACFADRGPWPGYRLRPAWLLVVPLLAFVNGAVPYLGLKTVSSYNMFSNLHTEQGATNHLLPGLVGLQLAPYQLDTVTLTRVDLRTDQNTGPVSEPNWVREKPPTTVPWLELRLLVADWRDDGVAGVRLEYERGGQAHVVPDALTDPELGEPPAWWQRHLLAFRAISSGDGPDKCRW
ncbi:hypothetical protein [Pseudonocardia acaciae]|uniref:hypothetical protein n=1 Tax=Pseudonocardia acaciae TaxID=551276 RepID=UPI00048E62D1|nr:hypothetical protein [Pseudonocardia acaciae]